MKKLGWVSLLFVSMALQAAPPAPQVRVLADIKLLRFVWASVPAAQHYELWYRATSNAAWRKLTERPDSATYAVVALSVHLTDWREVRYRVDACDFSGCTPSEPIAVDQLMPSVVGYFKAQTTVSGSQFGDSVALSADGRTLAATNTELVGTLYAPMVYVYRRVGSNWDFEARLVPQLDAPGYVGSLDNHKLALSGDGSVLVVGTPVERTPDFDGYPGAAHVFRRVDGSWQPEQKLYPANRTNFWNFGRAVEMDDSGTRIAVMVGDASSGNFGEVHLYRRVAAAWALETIFPVTPGASTTWFCTGLALSGDGQRLARHCRRSTPRIETFVQTFSAPAWTAAPELIFGSEFGSAMLADLNADGTRLAASHTQAATSMWRLTAAGWQPDSATGALALISGNGQTLSLSRNGNYVAIGEYTDATRGLGAIYPPFDAGEALTGTVRLFERRGGAWTLRQALKSNTATPQLFGFSLALGDNGSVLAVGALSDSSDAIGIGGNPLDTSAPSRGAVWLY